VLLSPLFSMKNLRQELYLVLKDWNLFLARSILYWARSKYPWNASASFFRSSFLAVFLVLDVPLARIPSAKEVALSWASLASPASASGALILSFKEGTSLTKSTIALEGLLTFLCFLAAHEAP